MIRNDIPVLSPDFQKINGKLSIEKYLARYSHAPWPPEKNLVWNKTLAAYWAEKEASIIQVQAQVRRWIDKKRYKQHSEYPWPYLASFGRLQLLFKVLMCAVGHQCRDEA